MAFNQAISGLKAAENELNVIGNNVSNSATTGFKKSRVEFQDVYAVSTVGGSGNTVGRGVDTARIAQQFEQGNVSFTDNALDLAVSGQGFFMTNVNGERQYTRDGAFSLDKQGFIVNSKGHQLLAFGADTVVRRRGRSIRGRRPRRQANLGR